MEQSSAFDSFLSERGQGIRRPLSKAWIADRDSFASSASSSWVSP